MSFRDSPPPLNFFGLLRWIDGRPLARHHRAVSAVQILYDRSLYGPLMVTGRFTTLP